MRVLVIGAGLSGLSATERLLDAGARVVVVDAFPVPGGRVASFDVPGDVAGLVRGDVVEHGLHAWFQHYHALFGLMARAGLPKPPLVGRGIYFWDDDHGHYLVEGGPLFWLINALRLPESLRGSRKAALAAFSRLIVELETALEKTAKSDGESAHSVLSRVGVPIVAIDSVFRPCMFSLTSLSLEELSGLEMLRWMSHIIPDPRIRSVPGGSTANMARPITDYLRERGADFRFGVEVRRIFLGANRRVRVELGTAPDRTGVRHVLVPGFSPAALPDSDSFDAIVCTLPWERLLELSHGDEALLAEEGFCRLRGLTNVHPLSIRLWFEKPIETAEERYILSSGTVFDVLRPTRESHRYPGIRLVDALVENMDTHLPELPYAGERFLAGGPSVEAVMARILSDLERLYPGQIRGNRVARRFLHSREGILACRPGVWAERPSQHIGLPNFVLAGDWTKQPYGVCMEGAVRSGQLAVEGLLQGRPVDANRWAFSQVAYSVRSIFQRV